MNINHYENMSGIDITNNSNNYYNNISIIRDEYTTTQVTDFCIGTR